MVASPCSGAVDPQMLRKKHATFVSLSRLPSSSSPLSFLTFPISLIFRFYQIRSHVKASPRLSTKVEVSLPAIEQRKSLANFFNGAEVGSALRPLTRMVAMAITGFVG